MNYIVDTHAFLWALISPQKISMKAKDILIDPETTIYVSTITFWEISIKYQLDKLDLRGVLPDEFPTISRETGFEILNLDADTASSFYKLPRLKNKDPFDRMLVWQTIRLGYPLITRDKDLSGYREYGLKTIW